MPAWVLGNFLYKQFVIDLVLAKSDRARLVAKYSPRFGAAEAERIAGALRGIADDIERSPTRVLDIARDQLPLLTTLYSASTADIENDGHRFGEDLPDPDKKALLAFLATL